MKRRGGITCKNEEVGVLHEKERGNYMQKWKSWKFA